MIDEQKWTRLALVGVLAFVFWSGNLYAHEIGTTLVSARFEPSGAYHIEVTTDALALVEKLNTLAGEPAPEAGSSPAYLKAQLEKHSSLFRRRFSALFDGVAVQPSIAFQVASRTSAEVPPRAAIVLTGPVPSGTKHFAWSYSWTFATYALKVSRTGVHETTTEWLETGDRSSPIDLTAAPPKHTRLGVAVTYLTLGFTHIVPKGLDHMLFVLGIFLLSRRVKEVLLQVSAFTIAHSITLALSIYGVISVPAAIVEPLIAVSIAYVAIENMILSELRSWRVALVFFFGLLHGMGFAGVLHELGLPRSEFITALVTFNAGVEAGQLSVIAAAFLVVGWWGTRSWYRRVVVLPASLLIACTAIYWTFERLAG